MSDNVSGELTMVLCLKDDWLQASGIAIIYIIVLFREIGQTIIN